MVTAKVTPNTTDLNRSHSTFVTDMYSSPKFFFDSTTKDSIAEV
jgi:hypothetical protein